MDTIDYSGVRVVREPPKEPLRYRWECERCKRKGPWKAERAEAAAGQLRHRQMHRAQDQAAVVHV